MAKEHGETGQFVETTTLDAVLGVFETVRGPVVTSADVADALDCSRDTARRKLAELYRNERVDRRETAGRVVWWLPQNETSRSGGEQSETAQNGDTGARSEPRSEAIDDVIGALDLPGSGKKIEARREAVGACVDALKSWETGWPSDFKQSVYPDYPAYHESGDDPANAWWKRTVYPGLKEIAKRTGAIEKPDTSGMWEWTGKN